MDSRRLVTALVIALGVCLLVIGIFIGREMREPAPIAPTVSTAPSKPLPPIFEPPPAAPPAPAPPASAVDSAEQQRVAQYFRDVDRIQNMDVDNPEATAQSLIQAASSGDSSGLRKLLAQARDVEQQVRAIAPPPPCAGYHKKLVSVLSESREMLQQLERGLSGGSGIEALPGLLSRANGEKSRSEALIREEKEIKRRYGL
ncbi:MAG: hypothetical protein ACXVDD_15205 [Polyangia bacterium]